MSPPEPPRRGAPIGRITELNVATAPHTPVPPPDDVAPTARPPAPDPRPPPRQYAQRPAPPPETPSLVPPAAVERYERELSRKQQRAAALRGLAVLLGKFLAAATGLAAALTVTVQLVNAWLEPRIKNVEAKQQATDTVVKPTAATAASADKSADACRDWARAYDDYNRQVLAKAGIIVPQPDNAAPVTPIELDQTPLPKAGKLTAAPLIRIKTKPPPLP